MVTFVSSTAKEFPIFWQAEIMTAAGRVCEEPVYKELWELRKSTNAAYLAFGEKKRPLPLKMEGRLLELVIYLRFFEADEGAADALLERLQQQVLKEIVSANWEELTSFITADLSGGRVSFSKQLSAEYRAAADAFECLG